MRKRSILSMQGLLSMTIRMKGTFILLIILSFSITACGTDIDSPTGEIIAPPGSQIIINPSTYEVTDASQTSQWHYRTFDISVQSPEGQPVGYVRLRISYISATSGVVQLYDGACSPTNPPANPKKDSPFEAKTDEYGTYSLCVGFQSGGGLEYKGSLEVSSGTVYNSADISIKKG